MQEGERGRGVSEHNLERSQTSGFCIQCLHYKPVSRLLTQLRPRIRLQDKGRGYSVLSLNMYLLGNLKGVLQKQKEEESYQENST